MASANPFFPALRSTCAGVACSTKPSTVRLSAHAHTATRQPTTCASVIRSRAAIALTAGSSMRVVCIFIQLMASVFLPEKPLNHFREFFGFESAHLAKSAIAYQHPCAIRWIRPYFHVSDDQFIRLRVCFWWCVTHKKSKASRLLWWCTLRSGVAVCAGVFEKEETPPPSCLAIIPAWVRRSPASLAPVERAGVA